MKIGDVVLVHDDTKRVNWKLAVIESVNRGADGMIHAANIRTATGRTNRPTTHLYPLEVSAAEVAAQSSIMKAPERIDTPAPPKRPVQEAAKRGQQQMTEWIASLRDPRRMLQIVTN